MDSKLKTMSLGLCLPYLLDAVWLQFQRFFPWGNKMITGSPNSTCSWFLRKRVLSFHYLFQNCRLVSLVWQLSIMLPGHEILRLHNPGSHSKSGGQVPGTALTDHPREQHGIETSESYGKWGSVWWILFLQKLNLTIRRKEILYLSRFERLDTKYCVIRNNATWMKWQLGD